MHRSNLSDDTLNHLTATQAVAVFFCQPPAPIKATSYSELEGLRLPRLIYKELIL